MSNDTVLIIDGYIDDPAALGVPPYISPMIRAIAGAAIDAGVDRVKYVSIDMIRKNYKIPAADISVVLSGNTVPGKYLRSMPMSLKELSRIVPQLKGQKIIGGSASGSMEARMFDLIICNDVAASLYDYIIGREIHERYRTLDEWNRWMIAGSSIVTQHQDFPDPLIVEIESYRGCYRYLNGGCSYCIEPTKGKPLTRHPCDIIKEALQLKKLGIRNIRIGGQTCIISYGSPSTIETPRPNTLFIRELFLGLKNMRFNTLHVDNANAAVISSYPRESKEILSIIANCCTDGNVLALGMESADPEVILRNNLNSTPDQVIDAIKIINDVGSERGPNGMPKLLPGINIIYGLDGETAYTYKINMDFLNKILDQRLMIRRINIRQVLPVRRQFKNRIDKKMFKKFKEDVRRNIDRKMLERIVPYGTILRNVYIELNNGNVTFGRQIGSYPLIVGIPYKTQIQKFQDIFVVGYGFRSITGITYPFDINNMPMSQLESLPGIGKKRASRIVLNRPFDNMDDLIKAIGDYDTQRRILDIVVFGKHINI